MTPKDSLAHPVYTVVVPYPPEQEEPCTCACGYKTTMGKPSLPNMAEHLRSHGLEKVEVIAAGKTLTSGTAQAVADFLDSVWNAALKSLMKTMAENMQAAEAEASEQAHEDS